MATSFLESGAHASNLIGSDQDFASKNLARDFYNSYNNADWSSLEKLFADPCYFHSNSGFKVLDNSADPDGFGSAHEEIAGNLVGIDQISSYLRKRRAAQTARFYLSSEDWQFSTPVPSVVLAWMSKPGATGTLKLSLHEVHVFQCNHVYAGEAIANSKISVLHEINLQNFEVGNA